MVQSTDINPIKLRKIIGKLPPGRARNKYEATLGGLLGKGGETQEVLENSTIQAVKIASRILNDDIWLILDREFIPHDGLACYYAEEIPLLRDKTPEELREIHKAKLAFPGCRVIQEGAEGDERDR